jgi:hypothetical protein
VFEFNALSLGVRSLHRQDLRPARRSDPELLTVKSSITAAACQASHSHHRSPCPRPGCGEDGAGGSARAGCAGLSFTDVAWDLRHVGSCPDPRAGRHRRAVRRAVHRDTAPRTDARPCCVQRRGGLARRSPGLAPAAWDQAPGAAPPVAGACDRRRRCSVPLPAQPAHPQRLLTRPISASSSPLPSLMITDECGVDTAGSIPPGHQQRGSCKGPGRHRQPCPRYW